MEHMIRDGKRLRIGPARTEDAEALVAYMNAIGGESDNLTFGEGECRFTVEMERTYLENVQREATSIFLLGRIDGEIVASGVITGDARGRAVHNATLGISVRKAWWRHGIGEIMMRELITFARNTCALRTIHLTVNEDNAAGIALYEKLGFERIGIHRDYFNVRGTFRDVVIMDLHLV